MRASPSAVFSPLTAADAGVDDAHLSSALAQTVVQTAFQQRGVGVLARDVRHGLRD